VELLCKTKPGLEAVRRHALAVPVLVKHIFKVSEDSSTESATTILVAICSEFEDIHREVVQVEFLYFLGIDQVIDSSVPNPIVELTIADLK
jgi:hypothetical protein